MLIITMNHDTCTNTDVFFFNLTHFKFKNNYQIDVSKYIFSSMCENV